MRCAWKALVALAVVAAPMAATAQTPYRLRWAPPDTDPSATVRCRVGVGFFENEIRDILSREGPPAAGARQAARAWRRRLPRTVDRYLHHETLAPFRDDLRKVILDAIDERFAAIRLT